MAALKVLVWQFLGWRLGFSWEVLFLWILGEILRDGFDDGLICSGEALVWWVLVDGVGNGGRAVGCVGCFSCGFSGGEGCGYDTVCSFDEFFNVAIESCGSIELLSSGMFDEDENETNYCSRRATISSLHSLIRRQNSITHSLKSNIVGLVRRRN